tara:strand:- start:353 stop:661 length:309 start_codon:yes stop_codon:yes gene_type:complete
MVTFRYKGTKPSFGRTDGGGVVAFRPGQVYEFDEDDKRSREFVKKILAKPDAFEVISEVGTKDIGGGVRTRSKTSRTKKEEVKPKAKPKKGKGLRKPKGKSK